MYNIYFKLNVGTCYYPTSEEKMRSTLECFNKLGIEIDRIEMA